MTLEDSVFEVTKKAQRVIPLTGRGPVYYRGCIRVPIESGIELLESELHEALVQAVSVKRKGISVPSADSRFSIDDAITNMKRLLA